MCCNLKGYTLTPRVPSSQPQFPLALESFLMQVFFGQINVDIGCASIVFFIISIRMPYKYSFYGILFFSHRNLRCPGKPREETLAHSLLREDVGFSIELKGYNVGTILCARGHCTEEERILVNVVFRGGKESASRNKGE